MQPGLAAATRTATGCPSSSTACSGTIHNWPCDFICETIAVAWQDFFCQLAASKVHLSWLLPLGTCLNMHCVVLKPASSCTWPLLLLLPPGQYACQANGRPCCFASGYLNCPPCGAISFSEHQPPSNPQARPPTMAASSSSSSRRPCVPAAAGQQQEAGGGSSDTQQCGNSATMQRANQRASPPAASSCQLGHTPT